MHLTATFVCVLALCATSRVTAETIYTDVPAWTSPTADTRDVALGDVDGDGDLDLVRASINQATTLHLNIGGVFDGVPVWSGPVEATRAVALGDVDGDGDLDLVRGNTGQGATLYRNIGGTFESSPAWTGMPELTRDVALADVNGDGRLDLVRGNTSQGSTVYLNVNGVFEAAPAWTGPAAATNGIALAFVDADNRVDLVLGNLDQPSMLFLNTGSTFASTPDWTSPVERTRSVALGDIDGDGDFDLVRGNLGTGATLSLNTNGRFDDVPVWTSPAESTWAVALGDVDDDGRLDLIRGNSRRGTSLYLNIGGTFAAAPHWAGPVQDNRSVALGDVDGDGSLDLVRGNLNQATTVHINVASPLALAALPAGQPAETRAVAVGDIDGDGDLDLVRGNLGGPTVLYRNEGGVLDSVPAWSGPVEATLAVALGDVDLDGDLDLVRGNFDQGATLYRNEGGLLEPTPIWTGPTETTTSIALGDVNGDGWPDLVRGNFDQAATLYLNVGGTFAATPAWSGPVESTRGIALGDVDGDGDLDLVRGNFGQGSTLYHNLFGLFDTAPVWRGPSEQTTSVALGDIDGDGFLDLIRGNHAQSATMTLNTGGRFLPAPTWSGPVEQTVSVALGDLDGDGDLDLVRGNLDAASTLHLNNGATFEALPAATLGGDSTWSAALADLDGDGDLDGLLGKLSLHVNRSPWLTGAGPSTHLPNQAAHLRRLVVEASAPNQYRVGFDAVDVENDFVWMSGEFQFEGAPVWRPMVFSGGISTVGPLTATASGDAHELTWDIIQIPFDRRDVVVRLFAWSAPQRSGEIQFVPAYLQNVGPVVPLRPSFEATPPFLDFPTITVGDTAEVAIRIANRGNQDLIIGSIESPAPEIEVLASPGLTIAPGTEQDVAVRLAPQNVPIINSRVRLTANDPAHPVAEFGVSVDVRDLEFETQLLAVAPELPLGEAATVVVTPADQVNIEGGHLFFGQSGVTSLADSAALVPQGSNFIALVPSESVTEAGLEYYVRVENSGVTAVDPPGAPDSSFFYPVASPAGVVANGVPNARGLFVEGNEVTIIAALPPGAQFVDGTLYYALGGSAVVDSAALELTEVTPGTFVPAATVADSLVGARGIDYRVRVNTLTTTLHDPTGPLGVAPKSIRVTVGSLSESVTHPADQYRLMTVPLDLELPPTSTLEAILSDQPEFGPANVTRWRSMRYIPSSGEYIEVTAGIEDTRLRPRPGRAFWLICSSPNAVDTAPVPGLSTRTESPTRITLQPGWNMIGNPFAFPVAWSDVSAEGASGPVTLEPPVAWDGNRYRDADVEILVPFEGYWQWNPEPSAVDLVIRSTEAPSSSIAEARPTSDDIAWRVRIGVEVGGHIDVRNFAGVDPAAKPGYDPLDRTDPPASPGGGVSLYFLDPARDASPRRTVDLRSPLAATAEPEAAGHRWVFDVQRDDGGASAVDGALRFEGLDRVPERFEVRLIDRALDRTLDLRKQPRLAFIASRAAPTRSSDARFELLIGSPDFVRTAAEASARGPLTTRLHPSFPNPIVSAATVRFEIAQAGPVRLEVFDLAGRRVRVLARGAFAAGVHELAWTGGDQHGRSLAPGIYTLRLTAGGRTDARKIVKVR